MVFVMNHSPPLTVTSFFFTLNFISSSHTCVKAVSCDMSPYLNYSQITDTPQPISLGKTENHFTAEFPLLPLPSLQPRQGSEAAVMTDRQGNAYVLILPLPHMSNEPPKPPPPPPPLALMGSDFRLILL